MSANLSTPASGPLLSWAEPVALASNAPDFGVHVEVLPADEARQHLRRKVWRDFLQIAGVSLAFAAGGGLLWALAAEGSFWAVFGIVFVVRTLAKLAFSGSSALTDWLNVPNFRAGSVEIYPDRIRWIAHDGGVHDWPASAIRQVRLRVYRHRKGTRSLMEVRFTRTRVYRMLVPSAVSFDAVERAVRAAGIPVSRPTA
jgi:hypothetical protein